MAGTFMSILDVTMVNLALPHIMTSLQTDVQKVKWVVTALMLTAAVSMPPTGWLGRRFGYERIYIFSLMVFTVGAGLCSVAWDLPSLVIFRIIEAVGGGIMQPVGMAIIVRTFPVEERGRALGFWGIGAMMAPTLGPTSGGYLTDWFGWRSIFAVNVPVGVLTLFLGFWLMRGTEREEAPPPFDWQGYLALAAFLVALLLGLEEGREEGWYSTTVLFAWAVAAVAFTAFIITELTVEHPVFPFALFLRRDFALGLLPGPLARHRAVRLRLPAAPLSANSAVARQHRCGSRTYAGGPHGGRHHAPGGLPHRSHRLAPAGLRRGGAHRLLTVSFSTSST